MIIYEHGTWGLGLIFKLRGSVFPKAMCWALPAAFASAALNYTRVHILKRESDINAGTILTSFGAFITILGFMVVFRSNQAWSRYWQGAMLMQQVRGEWYTAISSLFAFCNSTDERHEEVAKFQRQTVRLMSFLYACALHGLSGGDFEILNQDGIDYEAVDFLDKCCVMSKGRDVKCEVILQWLQRLISAQLETGILPIAAPILSLVFNELARGVVHIQSMRTINTLLFPFPYAQLCSTLLVVYTCGVPLAAGYIMDSWWGAAGTCFANVFVLWGVNYLAAELERPFGDDLNDLPLEEEMQTFNDLLRLLLQKEVGIPASYDETMSLDDSDIQDFNPSLKDRIKRADKISADLADSPCIVWSTMAEAVMGHVATRSKASGKRKSIPMFASMLSESFGVRAQTPKSDGEQSDDGTSPCPGLGSNSIAGLGCGSNSIAGFRPSQRLAVQNNKGEHRPLQLSPRPQDKPPRSQLSPLPFEKGEWHTVPEYTIGVSKPEHTGVLHISLPEPTVMSRKDKKDPTFGASAVSHKNSADSYDFTGGASDISLPGIPRSTPTSRSDQQLRAAGTSASTASAISVVNLLQDTFASPAGVNLSITVSICADRSGEPLGSSVGVLPCLALPRVAAAQPLGNRWTQLSPPSPTITMPGAVDSSEYSYTEDHTVQARGPGNSQEPLYTSTPQKYDAVPDGASTMAGLRPGYPCTSPGTKPKAWTSEASKSPPRLGPGRAGMDIQIQCEETMF